MPIPIIGETTVAKPTVRDRQAGFSIPDPATAPENTFVLSDQELIEKTRDAHETVRLYAVNASTLRNPDAFREALRPCLKDPSVHVADLAAEFFESSGTSADVESLVHAYREASGPVAASLANALARIAPEELFHAVKQRGRLDDEAYAASTTALATHTTPEIISHFNQSLDRSRALSAERRASLLGAALLSGDEGLCRRVLGLALEESKEKEPEEGAFASRVALAAISGLPWHYGSADQHSEVYDHVGDLVEHTILDVADDSTQHLIRDAIEKKAIGQLMTVMTDYASHPLTDDGTVPSPLGSIPARRQGLLRAFHAHEPAIQRLPFDKAVLFLAAATHAAAFVIASERKDETSPAVRAIAKILGADIQPSEWTPNKDVETLVSAFKKRDERTIRPVLIAVTKERFYRTESKHAVIEALIRAGHILDLMEALAEAGDSDGIEDLIAVAKKYRQLVEPELVKALGTIDPDASPRMLRLLLGTAGDVGTRRLGLAIARRFFAFRASPSRSVMIDALVKVGDPICLPLLEATAYPNEPEEMGLAILSRVHPREQSEDRKARVIAYEERVPDPGPKVRLRLACTKCGESLDYRFPRVYIDPDAKDAFGDPAFVGAICCKACAAEDTLVPTEEASKVMTQHMLKYLEARQAGATELTPMVVPARTSVAGKEMGLAAALKWANERIGDSPNAIRPRIVRARLRTLLRRPGVDADIDQILSVDEKSVEAQFLRAQARFSDQEFQQALNIAAALWRQVEENPDQRLYEFNSVSDLVDNLQAFLLELTDHGVTIPKDVHLSDMEAPEHEHVHGPECGHHHGGHSHASSESERAAKVGRNDACPCGSGKKYKKCHGAA
jgi:hypothetical protein